MNNPTEENTYRDGVRQSLDEILIQVKKTNGRVRSLEIWRGVAMGGLGVVTALVIPVLLALVHAHFL